MVQTLNREDMIKMTTREDLAKIRRELQAAERLVTYNENKKEQNKDLSPVGLPDKKWLKPKSSDIPNVVHLPPKQKRTENKW